MKNSHKIIFNALLLSALALMPAVAFEKTGPELPNSKAKVSSIQPILNNISATSTVQKNSLEQPLNITKAPDQTVKTKKLSSVKAKGKNTASQSLGKGFGGFLPQMKSKKGEEKDQKNNHRAFGTEKIPLQNPNFFSVNGFFGPWGPFDSSGIMAILYAKDSQGRLHLTYPDYDGSYHLFLDTQTKYSFNVAILSGYNNQSLKDYAMIMNFWRYILLPSYPDYGDESIFHDWAHPGNRQDNLMGSQFMFKEMPYTQPILDYDSGGDSGGYFAYPNIALYDPVDDGRIGEKFEALISKVAVKQPNYTISLNNGYGFLNAKLRNTAAIGKKEISFNPTYVPYDNLNTSSFYSDNIFSNNAYAFSLDIEDPSIRNFKNTAALEEDSGGPYYPNISSTYSQQFYIHLRAQPKEVVLTQSTTNFNNLMFIDPEHPDSSNYDNTSVTRNGFAQFTVPNDVGHITWTVEGGAYSGSYNSALVPTTDTQQNPNPKIIGNTATYYADLTLSNFTDVTTPTAGMLALHAKQADCQGNVYRYGTTLAPLSFFSYDVVEG